MTSILFLLLGIGIGPIVWICMFWALDAATYYHESKRIKKANILSRMQYILQRLKVFDQWRY